jgi:hypothetical protein
MSVGGRDVHADDVAPYVEEAPAPPQELAADELDCYDHAFSYYA